MALKTLSNTNFKIRSPSSPEIIFAFKPPKYVRKYQIGGKIGKGSYATVREAVDTNTNKLVAIKICSKRKLSRIAGGLRAVRKESKILSLLDHENTIKLIEKFTIPEKEKIYLVMEYLNCGNLDQLMQRNNGIGLPTKQVQSLFGDLLNGLKYLREKRIIHGDIKPENLLLTSDGRLVISDFGVSRMMRKKKSKRNLDKKTNNNNNNNNNNNKNFPKLIRENSNQSSQSDTTQTSDQTSEESIQFSSNDDDEDDNKNNNDKYNDDNNNNDENELNEENDEEKKYKNYGMNHPAQGTIAFEPPEVASGSKRYSKCGHELDLWAAGIVLFFISTGNYPFKGCSFMELIVNISNGVFEDLPVDLDPDLVFVIKSMLNVDPKKRPSIEEILSFPFMKKEIKSKKYVKMVENDSIFIRKKDGKFYFTLGEKKDQPEQCVIC